MSRSSKKLDFLVISLCLLSELADRKKQTVARLTQELAQWLKNTKTPIPTQLNPKYQMDQ